MTFACGVAIAGLHVVNRRFITPMYDVVLNLAAFLAAVASSVLLGHVLPAVFAALADNGWVDDGTVAVVERSAHGPELDWPDGWHPWSSRTYGDTRLEFAEYGDAQDS